MLVYQQAIPGSQVQANVVDELFAIADKYGMMYKAAAHDAFAILPIPVCTVYFGYWQETEENEQKAHKALKEATLLLKSYPDLWIKDSWDFGFEIVRIN